MTQKNTNKEHATSVNTEQQQPAEYDLYKAYQDYFEAQQRQVLANWTAVLNNIFWWAKK
jgi:hypothetical protein